MQKLDLQEQRLALAKATEDLSARLDSRLGVLVRLELTKMRDLLKSRSTVFPDYAGVAKQVDAGLTKLAARIKLLQQMDLILEKKERLSCHPVPPSLLTQVNQHLGKAGVSLGKTDFGDADASAAKTELDAASAVVDTLDVPSADFGQTLLQQIQTVSEDVKAIETKPAFVGLYAVFPGAWDTIKNPPSSISPDRFVDFDLALAKVILMRSYTLLFEGTQDPNMHSQLSSKQSDLAGYLERDSWEALCSARLLIREMKDGVYPPQLEGALQNREADIEIDPAVVL
jgi:hypothetical protein